jgi:hypothetical protein
MAIVDREFEAAKRLVLDLLDDPEVISALRWVVSSYASTPPAGTGRAGGQSPESPAVVPMASLLKPGEPG